jgi:hypothetical protein
MLDKPDTAEHSMLKILQRTGHTFGIDNSTVMDGNSHGRKPVVRPRIRWEEKHQEGLLAAAEYNRIVETSKGQGCMDVKC